jgi:peptidoglycan hydrolase-like protein with peptidoglycan-binding domain
MQSTRSVRAAWCAGAVLALVLTITAPPAAAETGQERADQRLLIPSAGWHGRPIRQPLRDRPTTVGADRPPRGWEAGPATLGTGTHRADGSQRVRELQWRLRALGYRPGPIDGIYGVRTRAAVAWFQVKHGFPVDGRASFVVVRHLRDRTTPGEARVEPLGRPAAEQVHRPAPVVISTTADRTPLWAVILFLVLAFALGFAVVALWRRPAGTRAIGYARVADRRLDVSTIGARCADHGIDLAGVVTDDDRSGHDQPGLAFAFERLKRGEADCLAVGKITHLARSPAELSAVLDAMAETPLIVLNAELAPAGSGRWTRTTRALSGGGGDG